MPYPLTLPPPFANADQPPLPAEPMTAPPMGLPPAPVGVIPPASPASGPDQPENQSRLSRVLELFALGAALGAGPQRGGLGLLQGISQAQQKRETDRQRQVLEQQRQQQLAMQDQFRRQQIAETQAKRKQDYIKEVQEAVGKAKTKEEYERIISMYEQFAPAILGESFRPHALRGVARFTAPSAVPAMRDALQAYLKNPINKDDIQSGQYLDGALMVDRYNDGHPIPVPMRELITKVGGSGIRLDENGVPVKSAPGELEDTKMSPDAQSLLTDLYAIWKRDHPGVKQIPPEVRARLKLQAKKQIGQVDDKPVVGERLWIVRDGTIMRVSDSQIRPGDKPFTPKMGEEGPSPYQQERNVRNLQSVEELLGKVNRWTTGVGSLLAGIPESDARNFAAELDTLKANIAFGELTAMREASKSGGALGQVSDREGLLLQSALGALDAGQSPDNIRRQLKKVRDSIKRWEAATKRTSGRANQIGRYKVQVIP